MGALKVYDGDDWQVVGGSGFFSRTHTLTASGDWRSWYSMSQYIQLLNMDVAACYPNGITINSIYLKADVADPTTEINANLRYCDAQGTDAFPGANITLVTAIDTTAGNYSSIGLTTAIPAGKMLYVQMDADPTDINVEWTLTINYTAIQ